MAKKSKTALTKSEQEEIDRRFVRHLNGESKSYTWSDAKNIILGDRNKKLGSPSDNAPAKKS